MEKWSVERKTLAGFFAAAVVLLLVIIGVAATMQTFIASSSGVWHTVELSSARERLYSALVDAISSQRTFAMTGEARYLRMRNAAVVRLRQQLRYLQDQNERVTPTFRQGVVELEQTVETLVAMLDETRQQRESVDPGELRRQLSTEFQAQLTAIRQVLTRLDEAGARQLATRLEDDDRAANLLYLWLVIIAVTLFVTLGWLSRRIKADLSERRDVASRLQEANGFLESSNRELESFCYSVSHDLRAPLRAINGFARLLEQECAPRLDGEAPRYLRTICNASERMGRLIDDLLEFSRIGRQVLDCEPTDMRTIVNSVVNDVLTAREKAAPPIDIGELPSIQCDRRLLHLVWLNLLDNAVKYSAASANPQIHISANAGEREVIFSIRDNGIGFDMRYYDKLFGVFQRLHADALYPGTGVGLAISQRIIARHGGRIWAESTPGKGALFCFSLPVAA